MHHPIADQTIRPTCPTCFEVLRHSALAYKGKDVDVQQVGKDLGVAGLVSGRVVQHGDQIEVMPSKYVLVTKARTAPVRCIGSVAVADQLRNLGLRKPPSKRPALSPKAERQTIISQKPFCSERKPVASSSTVITVRISASMEVEIILVEMDMMRRRASENTTTYGDNFNILVAKLKDKRPPYRLLGVWRQALLEASESAMILGKKNIADEFAAVLAREDP